MAVPSSSLCPGYIQVDAFRPDEDYEDEEVSYVTLDLGSIEPTLVPSSSAYRLIGLDTPTPFLQLSGTILKGRHDSLLGTELLLRDGEGAQDGSKRSVVYVANTEQRICFREVQLQAKDTGAGGKRKADNSAPPYPEDSSQIVDRVTGKTGPLTRAPRTRSDGTESKKSKGKEKSKGKKKGKEKAIPDNLSSEGSAGSDAGNPMDIT